MELTKNILGDSDMCLKPMFSYYENDDFGGSPPSLQGYDQSSPQKSNKIFQGSNSSSPPSQGKNVGISHSSSSSPSSSNSSGLVCNPTLKYHQTDEGNSIFGFKAGCANSLNAHTSGSLLSFGQNEQFHQSSFSSINNQEDFSIWKDNIHHSNVPQKNGDGVQFGWMDMGSNTSPNSTGMADLGREEVCLIKRACEEESVQQPKKQCISPTKQIKPNVSSSSKDPQSLAAKNRRERISERLKSLQELVPNGTKVDLVTMLEKAITYVKFLQLQVKILATDEFWPVQGGKAPKLSQVQDAIDTILTSQREGNSNSK